MTDTVSDWEREDTHGVVPFDLEHLRTNHAKYLDRVQNQLNNNWEKLTDLPREQMSSWKELYDDMMASIFKLLEDEAMIGGCLTHPAVVIRGHARTAITCKMTAAYPIDQFDDETSRREFHNTFAAELKDMYCKYGRVYPHTLIVPMGVVGNKIRFATRYVAAPKNIKENK